MENHEKLMQQEQERIEKASDIIEKTVKKVKEKKPYEYSLTMAEYTSLVQSGKEDICKAISMAYNYGFARGTRAKARNRVPVL